MFVERVNINSKILEELASVYSGLNACRIDKFRRGIARVKGFGSVSVVGDIKVAVAGIKPHDIKCWRTVTFSQEGERGINVSFPYLDDRSALKNPIEVFADCIVDIAVVEALVRSITEELIKANQT